MEPEWFPYALRPCFAAVLVARAATITPSVTPTLLLQQQQKKEELQQRAKRVLLDDLRLHPSNLWASRGLAALLSQTAPTEASKAGWKTQVRKWDAISGAQCSCCELAL